MFVLNINLTSCPFGALQRFTLGKLVNYFLKYPRPTEGGAAYHDGINTIAFEDLHGTFCRGDIPITDNRYMHACIALHLAD